MRDSVPPLVFVYLGNPPPRYARDCLIFASGGHKGEIVLLTNAEHSVPTDSRYRVEDIRGWYDPSHFESFRQNANLDAGFMGGFWFHVVERFFVLHQFMKRHSLPSLFHAELDVMVINLDGVAGACAQVGTGVFAVADDPSRALASLFYVNSLEKFEHFLNFALSELEMRNEMEMIGRYMQEHPDSGHAFPSSPFFESPAGRPMPSMVDDSVGLFDANAFGQWLFGLDPKIVKYTSRNHFRNEMVRFPIHLLQFSAPILGRNFSVSMPGGSKRLLRTLHVHSKIVRRLRFRPVMHYYLSLNRIPRRSVVTHRKGWWASRLLDMMLGTRAWAVLVMLRAIVPDFTRRLIVWLAGKAAIPMPNRQRERLNTLLPTNPLRSEAQPVERLWLICEGAPETEISSAIEAAKSHYSFGEIELVTSDSSTSMKKLAKKLGVSLRPISGEETSSSLAEELFEAPFSSVLLARPHELDMELTYLAGDGRQVLIPSVRKMDAASIHLKSFWSANPLRGEFDFADSPILIQKKFVLEMFREDIDSFRRWASRNVSATSQPNFAHAYGAWMWTQHSDLVCLARAR